MACRRAVFVHGSTSTGRVLQRGEKKTSPNTLTLMSYNILCDLFCTPSRFPQVPTKFLEPNHRFRCFQNEINSFDADIVCLQEAALVEWDRLNGFMHEQGYSGVHQSTEDHKVPLACFFKREHILLQWSEERSRTMLCEFQTRQKSLYVVNVHLEGKPDKSGSRLSQIHKALTRLHHHVTASGDAKEAKVIVAGDFNSGIHDGPCVYLDQGKIPAALDASQHDHFDQQGNKINALMHSFSPFREVYIASNFDPPFTHVRNHQGSRVDFIWATQPTEVCGVFEPVPYTDPIDGRKRILDEGIPNETLCSDHLPIGCQIYL